MKSLCVPKEYHLSKENNLVAERSCAHYLGRMQSLKDGLPLKCGGKCGCTKAKLIKGLGLFDSISNIVGT
jgi:hypothetical protein